jgi:FkbM family methyltransferase
VQKVQGGKPVVARTNKTASTLTATLRALRIRLSAALDPNRDVSFYENVNGSRVAVPGFTHTGLYRRGTTDADLAGVVVALPVDAVVADIGANVGEFTLLAAETAKRGHVHSFEPCPLIRPYLQMTLHMNNVQNVTVHEQAASDFNGEIALRFGSRTAKSTTDTHASQEFVASVDVPAAIGDDVLEKHLEGRLDFVKIDVEGAEAAVLRGLRRTLEQFSPIVILEMDGHADEGELLNSLRAAGYTVFDYTSEYGSNVMTLTRISGSSRPQSGRHNPNVIALPASRAATVKQDTAFPTSTLFEQHLHIQKEVTSR